MTDGELALFPGCAENLDCIKAGCVGLGVGDRLARVLKFFGITQYRLKRWLGVNCNCKARQEKLNRIGWLIAKRLLLGQRKKRPPSVKRTSRVNPACPVHGHHQIAGGPREPTTSGAVIETQPITRRSKPRP